MDTTRNLHPVDARRMARRAVIAAGLSVASAAVLPHPLPPALPSATDHGGTVGFTGHTLHAHHLTDADGGLPAQASPRTGHQGLTAQ